MDEDLEEALRAAAAEHPPDHQALLDALEAMAAEHRTPPPADESHHHDDDDLHLGPDIFELLKQEQHHDIEGVHQQPHNDTAGATSAPMATEPHPAPPSESCHQSTGVHEEPPETAVGAPAAPEVPIEDEQSIMDVLAAMFPPEGPSTPTSESCPSRKARSSEK